MAADFKHLARAGGQEPGAVIRPPYAPQRQKLTPNPDCVGTAVDGGGLAAYSRIGLYYRSSLSPVVNARNRVTPLSNRPLP
jgi:hypothetical protein